MTITWPEQHEQKKHANVPNILHSELNMPSFAGNSQMPFPPILLVTEKENTDQGKSGLQQLQNQRPASSSCAPAYSFHQTNLPKVQFWSQHSLVKLLLPPRQVKMTRKPMPGRDWRVCGRQQAPRTVSFWLQCLYNYHIPQQSAFSFFNWPNHHFSVLFF